MFKMDNLIKEEIIKNHDKSLEDLITFLKINTIKDVALDNMPFGEGVDKGLDFFIKLIKAPRF